MVGLFSKTPKDSELKNNIKKFKEFKKLLKAKKYEDALKSGLELLKTVPHHHDALFMVGGIYYLKDSYKIAIPYFERSLEIGSHDIDVLLLKAYSHQKLGENKQAIQCCETIMEIDPKNKSVAKLLNEINS
ncbi:MAG TPA: tetratricopeptide repeat protein [Nitrosopumilus sp.]|nr:tetratricopeptide repeat protein [Nitrosopumilus sp.]